ncbi:hypothetical protein [Clostridium chromiireducens]|uniref:Uncharacterized protein n=1 Tax=Clostridium chromiireducens TaxID=225345 RepID=A0A1V4IVJ3_9CLOT|nr:hypothetical protein [Clostridium chromiireducens]OPJ63913.1 hypothetical protein CLCHR_14320 [Clostridium chromiireducens]
MGNIMKINMYAEVKRKKDAKIELKTIEKVILEYNIWIKKDNREDKMENYERFIQA